MNRQKKKKERKKKEKKTACKERMIKKTSCSKILKWLCEMGGYGWGGGLPVHCSSEQSR